MTLKAQQQFVIGAMCIDDAFRSALFEAGERPPAERRDTIASLLDAYTNGTGVTLDPSVTDNVMNVVRSESPCRGAAEEALQSVKADVCPCWPC